MTYFVTDIENLFLNIQYIFLCTIRGLFSLESKFSKSVF